MTDPITDDNDTVTDTETEIPTPDADDADNPSREARNYRLKLREAEAARDALTARVELLQRQDIERVAAESLSAPADLWINGNGVAEYLDEDGNVDLERVRDDVKILVSERPGLRKMVRATDPSQGGDGNSAFVKTEPKFSDLFKR
jgi:hypothetical protein